eukprot:2754710-Amphidinium_carterae.1
MNVVPVKDNQELQRQVMTGLIGNEGDEHCEDDNLQGLSRRPANEGRSLTASTTRGGVFCNWPSTT